MLFLIIISKIYFNEQAMYVYNMVQVYKTVTQVKNGSDFFFVLFFITYSMACLGLHSRGGEGWRPWRRDSLPLLDEGQQAAGTFASPQEEVPVNLYIKLLFKISTFN